MNFKKGANLCLWVLSRLLVLYKENRLGKRRLLSERDRNPHPPSLQPVLGLTGCAIDARETTFIRAVLFE